jgi:hypothetical protein
MRCVRIATARVEELTAQLRAVLKGHEVARLAARVRRHSGATGIAPALADGERPLSHALQG